MFLYFESEIPAWSPWGHWVKTNTSKVLVILFNFQSPTSLSTGSYLDLPPEVIHASRTAGPLDNLRRTAFGAPPPQVERGTSMTIPLEAARGTNLGIPVSQGVPSSSVPSEFDLVGVRPRPQMAASTASDDVLSTSTVASQSASSQTSGNVFTHHLFHHFAASSVPPTRVPPGRPSCHKACALVVGIC